MKAKDYYQKYHDGILSADEKIGNEAVASFINDLIHEVAAMMKDRRAATPSAFVGVTKEINQKYLAVLGLFEKNDGIRPLIDAGFMSMLQNVAPEARVMLEIDKENKIRRMKRYGRSGG